MLFEDMDHKKITELISKYKAGTATAEEIEFLDKFWASNDKGGPFSADHTQQELQRIENDMFLNIQEQIRKEESSGGIKITPWLYKIAATFVIIAGFFIFWYTKSNRFSEIRTQFGEHRTVTLPDNSTVILNGNSFLKYASSWDNRSSREVWIEGEGFFSVTHTSTDQKFIVHGTRELNVEVLGTKFNIKTRDRQSEVLLTEGKLKVAIDGNENIKEVVLKPGDLASLDDRNLSTRRVKQQKYTSWMDNKLFFEHTSLRDLADILRDTYGLTVTFENSGLEKRELSGEISSATADDILYAIAETFDLKVERNGQSVIISANNK